VFCTHCGSRLPDGAVFCPTCGRQANRGTSCSNCTYRLPIGAAFCARCGRAVTPTVGPSGAAASAEGPRDETPAVADATPAVATGDPSDRVASSEGARPIGVDRGVDASERILPSNVATWAPRPDDNHRPSQTRPVGQSSSTPEFESGGSRAGGSYGPPPVGLPLQTSINPTVFGVYGHAWATVRERFWGLFVVGLIATIIGGLITGAINGVGALLTSAMGLGYVSGVASLLGQVFGTWPIWAGVQFANLQTVRSGRAEIDDIFAPYRRGLLHVVVAQIVTSILIGVAFVVLIIPGIVVALRLSFVTLLVVDEGYGPIEATRESWRRTSGYGWTLFGIAILAGPVLVLGVLALVVGVIPAVMVVALTGPTMFAAVTEAHGRRADGY
jgi:hypothetical protein